MAASSRCDGLSYCRNLCSPCDKCACSAFLRFGQWLRLGPRRGTAAPTVASTHVTQPSFCGHVPATCPVFVVAPHSTTQTPQC